VRGNAHYCFIYNVIFQDIAAAHLDVRGPDAARWLVNDVDDGELPNVNFSQGENSKAIALIPTAFR